MKLLITFFVFFSTLSQAVSASTHLDVYGVEDKIAQKIIKDCHANINQFTHALDIYEQHHHKDNEQVPLNIIRLREKAIDRIKQHGDFKYVNISTIHYSDLPAYTTIDIVTNNEINRIPTPTHNKPQKHIKINKELEHLFVLWNEYMESNIKAFMNNTLKRHTKKTCEALHCLWGFDEKETIDYYQEFKNGARKNTRQLINLIQHSDNHELRATAIFLLGHIENYQLVAKQMLSLIDDENSTVRNNAMRVLGSIMSHYSIKSLSVNKVIEALNYPETTDRNKASFILLNIANDKSTHQAIKQKAGPTLIKLLKLKQPNNHEFAYLILKKISHQNYGEHDIQAWEKWIMTP